MQHFDSFVSADNEVVKIFVALGKRDKTVFKIRRFHSAVPVKRGRNARFLRKVECADMELPYGSAGNQNFCLSVDALKT